MAKKRAKKTTKPATKSSTTKRKRSNSSRAKDPANPKTQNNSTETEEDTVAATENPSPSKPDLVGDTAFRVWKIDDDLKTQVKDHREALGVTVKDFVASAIHEQLPILVRALEDVGVSVEDSRVSPVRYQMLDETLKLLRYASHQTSLTQQQLVVACLRMATRKEVE